MDNIYYDRNINNHVINININSFNDVDHSSFTINRQIYNWLRIFLLIIIIDVQHKYVSAATCIDLLKFKHILHKILRILITS
jgi:hypothetical protein